MLDAPSGGAGFPRIALELRVESARPARALEAIRAATSSTPTPRNTAHLTARHGWAAGSAAARAARWWSALRDLPGLFGSSW